MATFTILTPAAPAAGMKYDYELEALAAILKDKVFEKDGVKVAKVRTGRTQRSGGTAT